MKKSGVDHKKIHLVLSVICTLFLCIHTNSQGIVYHLKKLTYGGSCKNYNGALNVICTYKREVCVINQVLVGKITIDNFLLTAKTISTRELPVNSFTVKNLKICPCCLWYRYITVMCLKLNQQRNKHIKVHHCLECVGNGIKLYELVFFSSLF